jgi:hypothetical protein
VSLNAVAEARRTTLEGNAEAGIVFTKGEAEAKALELRAQAYRQFNEAAVIQTVLSMLPEIVRAAAEPMGNIGSLTVLSSDGASEVVRTTTRTVAEAGAAVKGLTGIDIPALLGSAMGGAASPGGPTPPAPRGGRGGTRGGGGNAGGGTVRGSGASAPRSAPGTAAASGPAATDPGAALARADEAMRRSAAAGSTAVESAMAAAAASPAPGAAPAVSSAAAAAASPATDRAAGEPRPAPGIAGGRPAPAAGSAAGQDAERRAKLESLGRALRAVPGVERFGRLRLAELDRAGPGSLKRLWRETRDELETSYGQLTIGELLDRLSDSGPAATGPA